MMKHHILAIFIIAFILPNLSAQDLIFKTNGDTIKCIVTEVGVDLIKCRDFRSPEGPVYNILAKDVLKIEYENGDTSSFEGRRPDGFLYKNEPLSFSKGKIWLGMRKLDAKAIRYLYLPYPNVLSTFKSGKAMNVLAFVIVIPSAYILGYSLGTWIAGGELNTTAITISGFTLVGGFILAWTGNNNIKYSVSLYNSEISKTSMLKLDAGFTQYGVGVFLSF